MSLTDSQQVQQQGNLQQQRCRLPKLIVFDLDNTLWTPELYELQRRLGKNGHRSNKAQQAAIPIKAGRDINLYPGAIQMIDEIRTIKSMNPNGVKERVQFAVASRTTYGDWAYEMLDQFNIRSLFDYIEIFPGNKVQHLQNIRKSSNINFSDMIFFDDARDGKYGNCLPVSQLGVLSVHCPNGICTYDIYRTALERYSEWDQKPGTIVEWDGRVSIIRQEQDADHRQQQQREGIIKTVNYEKRYGFIRPHYATKDVFFHFDDLPASTGITSIKKGDKVSFQSIQDHQTGGKSKAISIQPVHSVSDSSLLEKPPREKINKMNGTIPLDADLVTLPAFSMSLPFAALLANGYKTLETRKGAIFVPYPSGTIMLLHIGQRIYPDNDKHVEIMKACDGLDDKQIKKYKTLKPGFCKGMLAAIVELGETYETTVEQRNQRHMQRKIVAYGTDSGKMVTEIKRVAYLKHPLNIKGQPGIFQIRLNKKLIPDGWPLPLSDTVWNP